MQRRLEKFLPIVLIALMVQILTPIGACWAAAVAASDPLPAAEICRASLGPGSGAAGDQGGQHRAHDGSCVICCTAQASAALDPPQKIAFAIPYRETRRVIWRDEIPAWSASRAGSNAQARAPPLNA